MTIKAERGTLKKLEKAGKEKGIPASFLEFYKRMFSLQAKAERRIGKVKPSLNKEVINERLQSGQPLISFNEIDIDWSILIFRQCIE